MARALLNVPALVLVEHAAEVRPALGLDVGARALAALGLDAAALLAELDAAVAGARAAEVSRALARAATRDGAAQRKDWLRAASAWGRTLRTHLALAHGELGRAAAAAVADCLPHNWGHRFDASRRALAAALLTLRAQETTLRIGAAHPAVVAGAALADAADALAVAQQRAADEQSRASAAAVAARGRLLEHLRRIHREWRAAAESDTALPDLPMTVLEDHQPRARGPLAPQSELEGEDGELEGEGTLAEGEDRELKGEGALAEGEDRELEGEGALARGEARELVGESVVVIRTRASIQ